METEIRQFTHYDIEAGLPQSQVYSLGQDNVGYLWIGTLAGLARYNGREFEHLTTADGLAGNQIEVIATGDDGEVWAGGTGGLCRLAPGRASVVCMGAPLAGVATLNALVVDELGLWVGTDDGLLQADPETLKPIRLHVSGQAVTALQTTSAGLWVGSAGGRLMLRASRDETPAMAVELPLDIAITRILDVGDRVWIGTERGLWVWPKSGRPERFEQQVIPRSTVTGLIKLGPEELMVSTLRGLYRIHGDDPDRQRPSVTRIEGLQSEVIRSMMLDREGLVWLGLDTGLARLVPTRFEGFDVDSGMLGNFVRAIAEDEHRRLWLGTRTGLQVVPVRDDRPRFDQARTVTAADGLVNERIYAIELLGPDQALLATNHGLVQWHLERGLQAHWTVADGLPSDHVRALARDGRDVVWVTTDEGVVQMVEGHLRRLESPLLSDIYAINLRIDEDGRKWFATVDRGLVIVQPDGVEQRVDLRAQAADHAVWDLWPAAEGGMWVGTNGDGLVQIDSKGNISQRLTPTEGLADGFVWSVLVDREGAVWAYTTRGLSRIDASGVVNHGRSSGLLHLEGVSTATLLDADGNLWFGSVGGLMRYRHDRELPPAAGPNTIIERARVDGRRMASGELLPANFETLSFEYATLSFRDEPALQYRYRLVGLGEDWSEPGAYRPVTYGRLPAGSYRFEVLGADAQGRWGRDPAVFEFQVERAIWQHPGVLALAGVVLMLLVAGAVRIRERQLRAHARSLEALVQARTVDLERANRQLKEVASSDPLTGLKNRRFLADQIDHDIAWLERMQSDSAALLFLLIDLDGFKAINDRYGHQAGDRVLAQVAELLLGQVRHADYVVRWGGDEFLVVARGSETGEGLRLAARISDGLANARFRIDDEHVLDGIDCSIGICAYPYDRESRIGWEHAIEIADVAVYRVKSQGGGRSMMIRAGEQISIADGDDYVLDLRREFDDFVRAGLIRILGDDS
ncbi:MAG: ligand-binding sensor domain-containing protein, partial [Wenzhouxiangellaceae bacterium]